MRAAGVSGHGLTRLMVITCISLLTRSRPLITPAISNGKWLDPHGLHDTISASDRDTAGEGATRRPRPRRRGGPGAGRCRTTLGHSDGQFLRRTPSERHPRVEDRPERSAVLEAPGARGGPGVPRATFCSTTGTASWQSRASPQRRARLRVEAATWMLDASAPPGGPHGGRRQKLRRDVLRRPATRRRPPAEGPVQCRRRSDHLLSADRQAFFPQVADQVNATAPVEAPSEGRLGPWPRFRETQLTCAQDEGTRQHDQRGEDHHQDGRAARLTIRSARWSPRIGQPSSRQGLRGRPDQGDAGRQRRRVGAAEVDDE